MWYCSEWAYTNWELKWWDKGTRGHIQPILTSWHILGSHNLLPCTLVCLCFYCSNNTVCYKGLQCFKQRKTWMFSTSMELWWMDFIALDCQYFSNLIPKHFVFLYLFMVLQNGWVTLLCTTLQLWATESCVTLATKS